MAEPPATFRSPVDKRVTEMTDPCLRLPVRVAPPPPTSCTSMSSRPAPVSKPKPTPKEAQAVTQPKQDKPHKNTKIMFLLKKSHSTRDVSAKSAGPGASNTTTRRNSTTTNEEVTNSTNLKKSNSILSRRWPNPTIIRPAASRVPSQPSVKKKPPPRPPPPKVNRRTGCIPVIPLDPPSYDEVLQADARASGRTQSNRPKSTKGLAPPRPMQSSSLSPFNQDWEPSSSVSRNGVSPLIDLTSPRPSQTQIAPKASSSLNDLLELEDIFGSLTPTTCNQTSQSELSGGAAQTHGGDLLLDLQSSDIFQRNALNENSNSSQVEASSASEVVSASKSTSSFDRPVPKPRTSLGSPGSKTTQLIVSDDSTPPLPPRPSNENGSLDDFTQSLGNETPPPLPPRPTHYVDFSSESDVFSSPVSFASQRSEPHGIALFDYTASQNDELSFKTDDNITLVHRINDDWLYGCLGENEGMFPRNFVQVVVPLPDDREFLEDGVNSIAGPRCVAMFDFAAESDEELSFHVGDIIRLVSRQSDSWVKGWLEGKAGLIPANFVRIIEDLPEDSEDVLTEAWVLHSFIAENPSELSCESGDCIKIIYPLDNDWVFAQNNNKIGLVPWTFLDLGR